MLRQILDDITQALRDSGVEEVYSAFDAKSVVGKSRGIFTTVGIGSFESSTPIYSYTTIYLPFKADVEISITAPEPVPMEALYSYYDEQIEPVVHKLEGLCCSLRRLTLKDDTNIQRLVLTVTLSASGMTKIERSSL